MIRFFPALLFVTLLTARGQEAPPAESQPATAQPAENKPTKTPPAGAALGKAPPRVAEPILRPPAGAARDPAAVRHRRQPARRLLQRPAARARARRTCWRRSVSLPADGPGQHRAVAEEGRDVGPARRRAERLPGGDFSTSAAGPSGSRSTAACPSWPSCWSSSSTIA